MSTPVSSITALANLRDLGGLSGTHGEIRPGILFRSDDVSSIDEVEAARVAALGIRLIIDLRSSDEQHLGRGPLENYPIDYLSLPILESSGTSQDLATVLATGGFTNAMMGAWYHLVLQRSIAQIIEGLTAIADADGPVLFHCAIGKDRTGIFAAALHGALGTHREQIVADYARTRDNLDHLLERLAASNPIWTPEAIGRSGSLLDADPEAMTVLLDAVDATGTDLRGLLLAQGASEQLLVRLRDWAVTPSGDSPRP